ncbi:hypothetical protein FE257_008543 [Aspergillus nanangensis]|uniref:Transcription factor domain-containing protein n=1 Tax=Aspergillus nanangensis TaxID=2582783 RepID=A0AAD4GTG6_ASPNN|nr:hypothetical protein FE257_008543 [Aspergillus nanangensis]
MGLSPRLDPPLTADNDQNHNALVVIITGLALFLVLASLGVRIFGASKRGALLNDDFALLAVVICACAQVAATIVQVHYGWGKSAYLIPSDDFAVMEKASMFSLTEWQLLTDLRVGSIRRGYSVCGSVGTVENMHDDVLSELFIATAHAVGQYPAGMLHRLGTSIHGNPGDPMPQASLGGHRWQMQRPVTILDILLEALILTFPIKLLYNIQMSMSKKLMVISILSSRTLLIPLSAIHLFFLGKQIDSADPSLVGSYATLVAELQLGMSVALLTMSSLKIFVAVYEDDYGLAYTDTVSKSRSRNSQGRARSSWRSSHGLRYPSLQIKELSSPSSSSREDTTTRPSKIIKRIDISVTQRAASREIPYSPNGTRDIPLDASIDSLPGLQSGYDSWSPKHSEKHVSESHLGPNDMIAPVSVAHSMSVNLLGSNNIFMESPTEADLTKDIILRGIVTEEHARVMYERFMGGSRNFIALFDPIRDTFDSMRSRSLFCFSVIIYLASRAVVDLRSHTHLQRVLQDEAQRLAEDSFFERPTKLETVQGMILLAAYSEKTWFSTALILRTALDSGLEKSLDTLLSQENVPRSSLSASLDDRKLVWQTRTWLISFTLELDVASGTGRKSRIAEVSIAKLRRFLEYPLSLPCDMRTVSIIEMHQLRGQFRLIVDNCKSIEEIVTRELPSALGRFQSWWVTWDEIHENNGFHAGAFQRSSLKLALNYGRIFALCASLARIQKLQSSLPDVTSEGQERDILNLWKSLVTTIMDQLAFIILEPAYRCQYPWAPTYPALTITFVTTFALRIARWRPMLIDQQLLLERAQQICDYLKQPPYPDIHRTVSIFVSYARALIADQRSSQCENRGDLQRSSHHDEQTPGRQDPRLSNLEPPPELVQLEDDPNYGRSSGSAPSQGGKEGGVMTGGSGGMFKPPLPRIPGAVEVPNWTLSNSIADSFGLFEEEQNDIFDFLPVMPALPQ